MYIHACGDKIFCFLSRFSNDAEDQYVQHILVHVCDFEFVECYSNGMFCITLCNTCVLFQELQFSEKDCMGGKKVHWAGEVQIVSKIHVWGTKKVTFCEMLIDNFSCSSCSNYDKWCPWFRVTPRELSGDSEEHEYGLLNPHARAHVAS